MSGNGSFINDPKIPLLGQKPRMRVEQVFVDNLKLTDRDGEAELTPQEDISLVELYKITLLMFWILGCPPIPMGDPQTQGKTPLLRALQWRTYIEDEQLSRHFAFRMRADQATEGNA